MMMRRLTEQAGLRAAVLKPRVGFGALYAALGGGAIGAVYAGFIGLPGCPVRQVSPPPPPNRRACPAIPRKPAPLSSGGAFSSSPPA